MHRTHIGLMTWWHLLSQNEESSTAYSTRQEPLTRFSKVSALKGVGDREERKKGGGLGIEGKGRLLWN